MKLNVKMEKSCGAVIWREQESLPHVLVLQHQNGGHWAFPKGHVEGKETEEQTALREIMEETGLKVKLDPGFRRVVTFSPKPGVMKDVVYFAAQPIGGKLRRQEEEVVDLRWLTLGQALKGLCAGVCFSLIIQAYGQRSPRKFLGNSQQSPPLLSRVSHGRGHRLQKNLGEYPG